MTLRSNALSVSLAVLAGLAAAPAGALADAPTALSINVASSSTTGASIPIGVNASFTGGDNGSQALTLFLLPPGAGACPADGVAPSGAQVLLSHEAADQVLIVNALSNQFTMPGAWKVCAYMATPSSVTASASQAVAVTGKRLVQATAHKTSKAKHKTKQHHASSKVKKTKKP